MRIAALGLLTAALLAGAPAHAGEAKYKAIMGGSAESLQQITIYVARAEKFFEQEGVAMEFVTMTSGNAMTAAVLGGSIDLTTGSFLQVLRARSEGAELVSFAMSYEAFPINIVLSNEAIARTGITPTMGIDEKVRRMKGVNIAISGPGSSTDTFARSLFLARGINPDGYITLQPIGDGPASWAAFQRKLVDGFSNTAPWIELAQSAKIGQPVVDPFIGEVPELKDVPYLTVITSRKTLNDKRDMIAAVSRALTRAMKLAAEQPNSVRNVRQFLPAVPEEVFNLAVEKYRVGMPKSPVITQQQFDKALTWMNIGASNPIKVAFNEVVATEPTRAAAAEILK